MEIQGFKDLKFDPKFKLKFRDGVNAAKAMNDGFVELKFKDEWHDRQH